MQNAVLEIERPERSDPRAGEPHRDPVTRLPGPAVFGYEGAKDLAFARRYYKDLALVLFKVGGLDRLRARYGGLLADAVARHVAACLSDCVRGEDTVARLGPDRFALIARESGELGARLVVQRLFRRLRDSCGALPMTRNVQINAGIATPRTYHCDAFTDFMQVAERSLELAVRAGPGRVAAARRLHEPGDQGRRQAPGADAEPGVEVAMWLLEEDYIDQVEPDRAMADRFAPLLGARRRAVDLSLGDVRVRLSRGA